MNLLSIIRRGQQIQTVHHRGGVGFVVNIKSPAEIEIMKEGGKITARVLNEVLNSVKPEKTLLELNELAEVLILRSGGKPSFKMVEGYNFSTCINLNEGVVHGRPSKRKIKSGDIVSVDVGVYYKGFHTDSAWTVFADGENDIDPKLKKFLEIGKEALQRAVKQCKVSNKISDISRVIQKTVEGANYSVVKNLVGHGVGRDLHEPPEIPGFVRKGRDDSLKEGMTLAIEVIYNQGRWPVVTDKVDGWTIRSKDGSIAALYEHTVAMTRYGPIVLTENLPFDKLW